jgi:hypothetical protein
MDALQVPKFGRNGPPLYRLANPTNIPAIPNSRLDSDTSSNTVTEHYNTSQFAPPVSQPLVWQREVHAHPSYNQNSSDFYNETYFYGSISAQGPIDISPRPNLTKRKPHRASQSCNVCRARKRKCDEKRPCTFCKDNKENCEYKEVPPLK